MDANRCRHLARIAAAAALGRRRLLGSWYRAALDEGVAIADLQEATLQVFLFAGYPRTIDAFDELHAAYGVAPPPPPPLEPEPGNLHKRGRALFDRIYAHHADTVLGKLESHHPDFAEYVIYDAYGQVLGRPFLPVEEREVMAISMLAIMDLRAQMHSHVLGALRVGATPESVRLALSAAEEVERLPHHIHVAAEDAIVKYREREA